MSAFLNYTLVPHTHESYDSFKARCLALLYQVTLLTDHELLALSRTELVQLHSLNYARFLSLKNPSLPQRYMGVQPGDLLTVPFYAIFPREMCNECWAPSEWDQAGVGATRTTGPIEVKIKIIEN